MKVSEDEFRVVSHDANDKAARCLYCDRGAKHVVVLPLTGLLTLDDADCAQEIDSCTSAGEELWVSLCAYCVFAMAKALARAESQP